MNIIKKTHGYIIFPMISNIMLKGCITYNEDETEKGNRNVIVISL